MKPANEEEYEKAEDKDGNKLKMGDTCVMEYTMKSRRKGTFATTMEVRLISMTHNGTWKVEKPG